MSPGYLAVIRELLSTGCLYVQSAHVDYLQALGFPAAKASSGCLTNPSSEHCHTVKAALCRIPSLHLFPPLPQKKDIFQICLFNLILCNLQSKTSEANERKREFGSSVTDTRRSSRSLNGRQTERECDERSRVGLHISWIFLHQQLNTLTNDSRLIINN